MPIIPSFLVGPGGPPPFFGEPESLTLTLSLIYTYIYTHLYDIIYIYICTYLSLTPPTVNPKPKTLKETPDVGLHIETSVLVGNLMAEKLDRKDVRLLRRLRYLPRYLSRHLVLFKSITLFSATTYSVPADFKSKV